MAKRYLVAVALAGCNFSIAASGPHAGDAGDIADAPRDRPIDAFDASVCPPAYMVKIGTSKYAATATNRMFWTQSDLCNADLPGATHLVSLDTVDEAMQLMAELKLLSPQPVASRYFVGAVQGPQAARSDDAWLTFGGAPLDPLLWSNFGANLVEPDDNGNLIEDGEEQIGVIDLTVTLGYLVDLSGLGNSGAVCECDGVPISAVAQQHVDADPNNL